MCGTSSIPVVDAQVSTSCLRATLSRVKRTHKVHEIVHALAKMTPVQRLSRIEEIFLPYTEDPGLLAWRARLASAIGEAGLWPGARR